MAGIQKYPLFGIPNAVAVDLTPIPLDENTRELYKRAEEDPSAITDAEMRIITLRPPSELEDKLCREQCGLSFEELLQKALRHEKLTFDEAKILMQRGVEWKHGSDQGDILLRLPADERELRHAATEAVTPQSLKDAMLIAKPVYSEASAAASAAVQEYYQGFEVLHIRRAHMTLWQKHILEQGNGGACGLVLFYPAAKGSRWERFKAKLDLAVYHGLRAEMGGVKELIMNNFQLCLIEAWQNTNSQDESLQERFRRLRDAEEVPAGLRNDAFLYVNDEALHSIDARRPFLWLWEPEDTEFGPLRVELNHIMPLLVARLTQRDLEGEARIKPFRFGPEFGALHKAASCAKDANMPGIWPPMPRIT
ncbi:hypothetical protein NLU13_7951 [Sarocladium strictum]|uniref:Uncharacterized protein n=1 Tax=Sarocladium strictum TaxID=5046 RepID=A0AA39GC55_SARSR|nr:hypothetical protein NLU13_7951 [Sarocladium strictum]